MKLFRNILPFFIVILLLSACAVPPIEEDDSDVEIDVFGLYPAGNDQFTVLYGKYQYDRETWSNLDSLIFLRIDSSGTSLDTNGQYYESRPYIRDQYLLDDGNIMLFGNLNSDIYSWYYTTAVYTPDGTLVWTLPMADRTNGVIPASDGGLFVLGWDQTEENYDIITYSRTDAAGDTLWSKSVNTYSYNASLRSGTTTTDGGCVATGGIYVQDRSTDILVAKINSSGDTLWTNTFGGDRHDYVSFVEELSDGSILIVGELNVYDSTNANWGLNSGEQVYLIKISASGETLWTKAYGNTLRETANGFIELSDGSLILLGKRSQSYVYLFDTTQGWVSKLSAEGEEIWLKEFDRKLPVGVREVSNGDILIVTNNLDSDYDWNNAKDLNLMKYTSSGTLIWDKTLTP